MKTNLSKRMISLILAIVLLVGVLPTAAFATEEEEATTTTTENVEMAPVGDEEEAVTDEVTEDKLPAEEVVETTTEPVESVEDEAENVTTPAEENVVNATATTTSEDVVSTNYGRTFRMPGRYYDFITSHERYGTCDYLAYVSGEELIIFFFDEDISDKEFVLWDVWGDDYASGFGARFGCCPKFTSYTYDKNTFEIKSIKNELYIASGPYKFTYTYVSSFDVFWYRYNDPRFYDHAGSLPRIDIPNPPADAQNVTMGRNFTLPGDNVWVLQNCEEYGKKDYLAFVWEEIYVIWFFDDISDVKFYKWDFRNDLNQYFGVRPSRNIPFTKYTFNRSTLKFNEKEELMLTTDNLYGLNYNFNASIDIYWDNSYDRDNMFYDHSGTLPKVEVQNPPEDIWNVTNGKAFHAESDLVWLLQNHNEYASKDFLAYEWNDDIRIWFFDDISNVKFSAYEKFGDNFVNYYGIRPSADVTFTEYVYKQNTLNLKRVEERSFITSNGFTFMYPFMASFDIYTDDSRTEYFYEANRNWSDNPNKGTPVNSIETKTVGNTFSLAGSFINVITHHSEFGKKDYFAYVLGENFEIVFFEDTSNVKFTEYRSIQFSYFYMKASQEVKFTQYTYDSKTLKIKNVKPGTSTDLANLRISFYFIASFDIYGTSWPYFYLVNGELPTLPTPYEKVLWSKADKEKFHMDEVYCNKIKECPEYKQGQRYLSYLWINDFVIWFFDDPNIKFSTFEKYDSYLFYFCVNPSSETQFKAYVYDRNTLELKDLSNNTLGKYNGYTIPYDFVANIDIYKDETYTKYFYKGSSAEVITNTTHGKNFAISNAAYAIYQNLTIYGGNLADKNYIAYALEDELTLWFLDDSTVRVSVKDRRVGSFSLQPSSDVQVTAYVYDRTTLKHKETKTFTFKKSNDYSFNYNFLANFNIYTNSTHAECFYDAENNGVELLRTFQPLSPAEAEELLRFISRAGALVDVKEKLPDYYKLLIGEIIDPKQELETKIAFVSYFNTCMDIQLAEWKQQTNFGMQHLMEWLEQQDSVAEAKVKDTLKDIFDDINELVKENYNTDLLDMLDFSLISDTKDIASYSWAIVHCLGLQRALEETSNINYLNATINLLYEIEKGDETDIKVARTLCSYVSNTMVDGSDPKKMQQFAGYIFSIMRSLP